MIYCAFLKYVCSHTLLGERCSKANFTAASSTPLREIIFNRKLGEIFLLKLEAVTISKSTARYSKFVIKISLYFVYLILNATASLIRYYYSPAEYFNQFC